MLEPKVVDTFFRIPLICLRSRKTAIPEYAARHRFFFFHTISFDEIRQDSRLWSGALPSTMCHFGFVSSMAEKNFSRFLKPAQEFGFDCKPTVNDMYYQVAKGFVKRKLISFINVQLKFVNSDILFNFLKHSNFKICGNIIYLLYVQ